jgi:hypothetical protein
VSGQALASWDLAEQYGIDDADGRRPHWGRHIAPAIDEQWTALVDETRAQFTRRNASAAVRADRDSLTLHADDVARQVLDGELFFSSLESISAELYERWERATTG